MSFCPTAEEPIQALDYRAVENYFSYYGTVDLPITYEVRIFSAIGCAYKRGSFVLVHGLGCASVF